MKKTLGIGALILGMAVTPVLAGGKGTFSIDEQCDTRKSHSGDVFFGGEVVDKHLTDVYLFIGFESQGERYTARISYENADLIGSYVKLKSGDQVRFHVPPTQGYWAENLKGEVEWEDGTIHSCEEAVLLSGAHISTINGNKVE